MNQLPFVWNEPTPLLDELKKPIDGITIYRGSYRNGQPHLITLWHTDGTGLMCYSMMTVLAERLEVGSLHFARVTQRSVEEFDLSPPFTNIKAVFKLSITESGTLAEAGLILVGDNDEELTIVAAAFPLALAISGVPIENDTFHSEYPLSEYERLEMT